MVAPEGRSSKEILLGAKSCGPAPDGTPAREDSPGRYRTTLARAVTERPPWVSFTS